MSHLPQLIIDLALLLGVGAVTTLLFKWLKQPVVLGYLLAGLLVGPHFSLFPTKYDLESIRIWADIGVIILLFSLGLEFSIKKLAQVGGSASITGIVEIGAMLGLGYLTGSALGWSTMDSIFLGGIIAISSTTIIFRAFDELGVKSQRFASLVFGVLVVEDLVAILLLVLLSTLAASDQLVGTDLLLVVLKLAFFLVMCFLAGIFLIPSLLRATRKFLTDETLLIISLGLCLLMVMVVTKLGFSPALGAFIIGSILAETLYAERIEHLIQPIKDLFGAVFFVSVGMLINPAMLVEYAGPILLITVVVIGGKAVHATLGSLISGQPLKQAIQTGLSLTQIGEFSFIIATLGVSLKVTSGFLYPIAVAVSAITTFTTPYMIRAAEPLHRWVSGRLSKRTKLYLDNYSSGAQTIAQISSWRRLIRAHGQTMLTNGVVLIGIILLVTRWLLPFLLENGLSLVWSQYLTGFMALLLMAPFIWALGFRKISQSLYTQLWTESKVYRGPLVALSLARLALAVGFVLLLLDQVFSVLGLLIGGLLLVSVWFLVGKRVSLVYELIERRFLLNLNARQLQQQARPGQNLLPWDAHLTYFKVSPESTCVGKTLEELALRERFGVNLVSIERGRLTLLVPTRLDRLYPGDQIAVIGTDVQLEQVRGLLEIHFRPEDGQIGDQEVSLEKITVGETFPYLGESIKSSGIREKTQGLIVGIERAGERLLNPESSTVLLAGDVVWLAGNTRLIRQLQKKGTAGTSARTASGSGS